jgi:exosome complex component RRP4
MSELLVKNKDIVVPGDELARGIDYLPSTGTYRQGELIISSNLGMAVLDGRFVKVIPLSGKYFPKTGDVVVGSVKGMTFSGWIVDIGCAYSANLSIRDIPEYVERGVDLEQYYDFSDVLAAKITKVTRSKNIDLSTKGPGLKKLIGGKIITITPSKVPRLIGKNGSMVSMIKEKTNTNIVVGQNGRVWIKGENLNDENLVTRVILKIEQESHLDGLTDEIKNILEKERKESDAKGGKK